METVVRAVFDQQGPRPGGASRTPRPRLLPTLMFLPALFLTVKIGMIWQSAGDVSAGGPIAVAGAEAKSAAPEKAEASAAPAAPPAPASTGTGTGGAAPPTPAASTGGEAQPDAAQGPAFSPAEVDVLRQLAVRREQLEARARELDKRDALLRAAESRIDAKATALKELQAQVSRLLKSHDEQQEAKMASLARLYESMKPKDAATILQSLEIETLLLVVERIKERKLAAIMAEMNPTKARDVTAELIRKRKIEAAARPVAGAGGAEASR
jgi:flagellar motility protein MotE (MotC chaperone)